MNDAQYVTMLKGFADLATRMNEGFTRMDKQFDEQEAANRKAHQEILNTIGSYIQDVELRWNKKWTNHDQRLARLKQ